MMNIILLLFSIVIFIFSKPITFNLQSESTEPIEVLFTTKNDYFSRIISFQNNDFAITNGDKMVFLYKNDENKIISDYVFNVENDFELKSFESEFKYGNQDQWKLYIFEDFQGLIQGWNKNLVSKCGNNENLFLGGHCNFANDFVYKRFENLPKHEYIMIKFNVHFLDDWNGEELFCQIDKNLIWKESYAWCDKVLPWYCKKYGINVCGSDIPDRLSHPVSYVGKHNSDMFTITFGSTLNKNPCDASWGIDDLQIYLSD